MKTETSGGGSAMIAVDGGMLAAASRLDQMSGSLQRQMAGASGHFERAIILANGVRQITDAVNEKVVEQIKPLMGIPTGFGTDKRPDKDAPYDNATLKKVFIHSLLHGLYPVGNEWMIYRGNLLVLRNGWERKFRELGGVTDIEVVTGAPSRSGNVWLVKVVVRWKKDGRRDELRDHEGKPGRQFAISATFDSEKGETVAGKATAKAIKLAYQQASGERFDDDDELTPAAPTPTAASVVAALPEPAVTMADLRVEELKAALGMSANEWKVFCLREKVPVDGPYDEKAAARVVALLEETLEARTGEAE